MKKRILPLATAAALAVTALAATPAVAGGGGGHGSPVTPGDPVVVASGLVSPLSLEVDRWGVAYVSQNFVGELTRIGRDGTTTPLVSAPGEEISAVSSRRGTVYFAQLAMDHSSAALMSVPAAGGTPGRVADLYAYEASANPDAGQTYGFQGLSPECTAQFPPAGGMVSPPNYTGLIDTHPYASLATRSGVYVADAGMNAILRVGYDGAVSTVAVLPPQPAVTATAEILTAAGLPVCAAGAPFIAEPVPTDVELGPDRWLYVTTLPGGPEDPSLGARGSVYKVNPRSGEVRLVATGFTGATGLAVSTSGTVYVSELFGGPEGTGQISTIGRWSTTPTPLLQLAGPTAIEPRGNRLYVSTDSLSETGASLSTIRLGSRGHWLHEEPQDDAD